MNRVMDQATLLSHCLHMVCLFVKRLSLSLLCLLPLSAKFLQQLTFSSVHSFGRQDRRFSLVIVTCKSSS